MSDPIPANALDLAILALQRSRAGTPEFYRQLAQGDLCFLVNYHPEIENEVMELKNGSPLPFAQVADDQGAVVPLFSSIERANEGLKKGGVPPRTYSIADMPARQVLEILGNVGLRAVINKGCATGTITIPPDLMRDLASGKALAPIELGSEKREQMNLNILNPADYPTDLIQPVFEVLRRHRNFRAAWIFSRTPAAKQPAHVRIYHLLILMEPRDEVIFHELNMVAQAANNKLHDLHVGLADEADKNYLASLFKQAQPFYVATGYRPPAAPAA
jgi:hypothetical protein